MIMATAKEKIALAMLAGGYFDIGGQITKLPVELVSNVSDLLPVGDDPSKGASAAWVRTMQREIEENRQAIESDRDRIAALEQQNETDAITNAEQEGDIKKLNERVLALETKRYNLEQHVKATQ